mgnify:CR=1 FL=1
METTIWQNYPQDEVIVVGIINTSNQSQTNNFIEENVFSGNGWRAFEFGDVMPFQMVVTFKGDNENVNKWRNIRKVSLWNF